MPCHWHPTTVINPRAGIPFTDISAWHYIAELVEAGHEIGEVVLEQPVGEKAYVITVQLETNLPELYIKFQLKNGNVFGRSFHYSTK
jgi:hypothetical protein